MRCDDAVADLTASTPSQPRFCFKSLNVAAMQDLINGGNDSSTKKHVESQYGLQVLVPKPGASATTREIDIVFVHGLGGDCLKTWTYPGKELPWIADPEFLGEKVYNTARVMTFGYNSNVFRNVTTNRITDHATDLLEGLWANRYNCNGRPLIFIAHSLGGLIVKQALVLCHDEDRYNDIQEMTRSIVFMGTPHEGSDQAAHLKIAQKIVTMFRATHDMASITKELERYSATTMDINKSFMRKASNDKTLLCFFETIPTRLPQGERLIVHQASAVLNGNGARSIGMACNHQELCKFSSPAEARFQSIFWLQVKILLDEAVEYAAKQRVQELKEEEMMSKFQSLKGSITEPTTNQAEQSCDEAARQEFLASMSGFTAANFADNLAGPQPGTCTWIERHKIFRDGWTNAPESKLLFITGAAGCGKSCLAKHIRNYLQREFTKPNFVLAFFCNNTRIHQNESPILQYFLKELIKEQPAFFDKVDQRYRTLTMAADTFRLESLMEILKSILKIKQERKIFLIIDGLDECDPSYTRKLLKLLQWMLEEDGPGSVRIGNVARIAILCRPSPDIEGWALPPLHLDMPVSHTKDDLAKFVKASLQRGNLFSRSTRKMLAPWVIDRAGDSFLWANSVIEDIEQLKDASKSGIIEFLSKCPRDMERYYDGTLTDLQVSSDELVLTILDIVLWGRRPLSIGELRAAASLALVRDLSGVDLVGKMQRSCGKLLRVTPGKDHEDEVTFVHHTLRELLVRGRDEKEGHRLMARICLQYIIMTGQESDYELYNSIKAGKRLETLCEELGGSHRFLEYAVTALFEHTRLANNKVNDLLPLFDVFLRGYYRFYRWWYFTVMIFDQQVPLTHPPPFLHTLAYRRVINLFEMTDVLDPSLQGTLAGMIACFWSRFSYSLMLRETPDRLVLYESVLERDCHGRTLLHAAAADNSFKFAYLWRDHSTEIDPEDKDGYTPLFYAIGGEFYEFVTLLMDWGADPFHTSRELTPLKMAVDSLDHKMISTLLARFTRPQSGEKGSSHADFIPQSLSDQTIAFQDLSPSKQNVSELDSALRIAVFRGREDRVRLLLDRGADPKSTDSHFLDDDAFLLGMAISRELDAIFDMLLSHSDLETLGNLGNALHYAIAINRQDYVEKIINQSRLQGLGETYLDSRSLSHARSPGIILAALCGNYDIMKLLLENGALPDTVNDNGSNALHWAADMNAQAQCQLLIDYGCDVNIADKSGRTALLFACSAAAEGVDDFVATLLEAGADPQIQDRAGQLGPLHSAAGHGYTNVIQKLLAHHRPPDMNAWGKAFPTPLHFAIWGGHSDTIKLLLENGADVNIILSDYWTAMRTAVATGNLEIAEILLCHGADLREGGRMPWSSLHMCAAKGDLGMLKLLTTGQPLEVIDLTSSSNITALWQACSNGHFKCAMHLIKIGSAIGLRFGTESLLHAAAFGGNRHIIRHILWKHDFDINDLNNDGHTPLAIACLRGNPQAATTLIRRGADPFAGNSMPGSSVLFLCTQSSSLNGFKITKLLLRGHRAQDWVFRQRELDLALLNSVRWGCIATFKLLLENGADPNARREEDDLSCLYLAVRLGQADITRVLLNDPRTNIFSTDCAGRTALHIACMFNRVSIIVMLLLEVEQETSPSAVDKLLRARDLYSCQGLDYRFLLSKLNIRENLKDDRGLWKLAQLQKLLENVEGYESGDSKYSSIGKCLVFIGDDKYAIEAYQMCHKWSKVGKINLDMDYCCHNCGVSTPIGSSRMVCRVCADLDLCENCHVLYEHGSGSGDVCDGHEFLRVPFVSENELQPQVLAHEGTSGWHHVRTAEDGNALINELKKKYCASSSVRGGVDLDCVGSESEAPLWPCFTRRMDLSQMFTANLRLSVRTLGFRRGSTGGSQGCTTDAVSPADEV